MSVASVEFLLLVLGGSAFFFFLPSVRARQCALAIFGAYFLATQVPNIASLLVLVMFLTSGYGVAALLVKKPRTWIFAGYLTLLLATFLVLKKYEFLRIFLPTSWLSHPIGIAGLSYVLFRQIHFVVDAMQEQIEDRSLWVYLHYQLNPFGLLSGPILRYQDFQASFQRLTPLWTDKETLFHAYKRLLWGIVKLAAIAPAFLSLDETCGKSFAGATNRWLVMASFAGMFYSFPAYIYFNFSGYCDVVIAAASLFGLELPENFDKPYLARNMIDYWNRWHRSLSFWIRDYVFTPMYKAIAERWPTRAQSLAFVCFFVALFLAGVWHGSKMNWVVFGLLNGIGVSVAKLWENRLVAKRGRAGLKEYLAQKRTRILAIVANAHFACLTMLFFKEDLGRTMHILSTLVTRMLGTRLPTSSMN